MNIKSIAATFLIIFCINITDAQDYLPVIVNGGVFFKTELETSDGMVLSEVTVANFEKINGVLYNRVFFKRGFEPDMFIGHLREEPGVGKLFFRPLSSSEDLLVCDLGLEVGDIINLSARWCDSISGDAAEVVEVIEQEGAKEIIFDRQIGEQNICEPLRFIEGVGPNASVIFPYFKDAILENGAAQRICHASHEAVIYYPANTTEDFCGLVTTETEDIKPGLTKIYPNPAQDYITFQSAEVLSNVEIAIYNSQGVLIWNDKIEAGRPINISQFAAGIYYTILKKITGWESSRFVKM